MSPTLETGNLKLRPSSAADLDALHRLWTDAAVRRFLFDDREISRDDALGVLVRSAECFRDEGYGLWVFFEKGQDSLAGFAGLLRSLEREASLIFGARPNLLGPRVHVSIGIRGPHLRIRDARPRSHGR